MMPMITIAGTSHVSPESLKKLRRAARNKDCICVELDPIRYQALVRKDGKKPPGLFPKLLHYVQQRLGRKTGIMPGEDMLQAVQLGREEGKPVYLIDQDIRVTLYRLKRVPLLEKLSLFVPLIIAPASKSFDVRRVPSERIVTAALKVLKHKAPGIYDVLVVERNVYMAAWVNRIAKRHRNVLVVVGAAHARALGKLLKSEGHRVKIL